MILNLSGEIVEESVEKLIGGVNGLYNRNGEKLFIYFTSEGGSVSVTSAMIDIINQNVDLIELVGYGELFSAGFNLFFKSKCNKILLSNSIGMCHISYMNVEINENLKLADPYGLALKKSFKKEKLITEAFCKSLGMTSKEMNSVLKGKDAYFDYSRMLELMNYQKANGEHL